MATYEEMLMNQSAANSAFNASQAEENRNWNEYMSNTQHQRETKDLIAAGLNPVLSANSGASWGSVANASADPNSAAGLAGLATTILNNAVGLEQSKISAEAAKAAAGATAAATMYAAEQSASASKYAAELSNEGTHFSAEKHYQGVYESSPVAIAYKFGKGAINGATGSNFNDIGDLGKTIGSAFVKGMQTIGNLAAY